MCVLMRKLSCVESSTSIYVYNGSLGGPTIYRIPSVKGFRENISREFSLPSYCNLLFYINDSEHVPNRRCKRYKVKDMSKLLRGNF